MNYYKLPDMSYYQYGWNKEITKIEKYINFEELRQQTRGIILRASQGNWQDKAYKVSCQNAKAAGLLVGNYHYYDNRYHPKRQAEAWAASISDEQCVLGAWLDLEDSRPGQYKTYLDWADCMAYFMLLKPNIKVGIYTRASYFNDPAFSIPVNHVFRFMPLWVAHYNPYVTKPDLPKGWIDWELWQVTDDYPSAGWGAVSKDIDINYFNGSEADFTARYGVGETPTPKGTLTVKYGNNVVEYRKAE